MGSPLPRLIAWLALAVGLVVCSRAHAQAFTCPTGQSEVWYASPVHQPIPGNACGPSNSAGFTSPDAAFACVVQADTTAYTGDGVRAGYSVSAAYLATDQYAGPDVFETDESFTYYGNPIFNPQAYLAYPACVLTPTPPPSNCGTPGDEFGVDDSVTPPTADGALVCLNGCQAMYHTTEGLHIGPDPQHTGVVGGDWYTSTGSACSTEPQAAASTPAPATPGPIEQCKQVPIYSIPDANGNREVTTTIPICTSTDSSKAGEATVDGVSENYSQAPSNVCLTTESGNVVCDTAPGSNSYSQPTPPAPNEGPSTTANPNAPTTTADPTGCVSVVSGNTTTTTCEYSSQTVSNSTTTTGGGTGTTGSSTGGGTTGTTGTTTGSTSGTTGGDGSFSANTPTDGQSFGQTLTDFQNTIAAAPISTALSGLSDSIPTGGTPLSGQVCVQYFNNTCYDLSPPQAVVDAVVPIFQIVMLLVWAAIAIQIFFKA